MSICHLCSSSSSSFTISFYHFFFFFYISILAPPNKADVPCHAMPDKFQPTISSLFIPTSQLILYTSNFYPSLPHYITSIHTAPSRLCCHSLWVQIRWSDSSIWNGCTAQARPIEHVPGGGRSHWVSGQYSKVQYSTVQEDIVRCPVMGTRCID